MYVCMLIPCHTTNYSPVETATLLDPVFLEHSRKHLDPSLMWHMYIPPTDTNPRVNVNVNDQTKMVPAQYRQQLLNEMSKATHIMAVKTFPTRQYSIRAIHTLDLNEIILLFYVQDLYSQGQVALLSLFRQRQETTTNTCNKQAANILSLCCMKYLVWIPQNKQFGVLTHNPGPKCSSLVTKLSKMFSMPSSFSQ